MVIKKTLEEWMLFELRDHRDNTAWELIKCYTIAELSLMDWIDTRAVKNSKKYLPVRVDYWEARDRFRQWIQSKPYRIFYIRLDEIKYIYDKRNKKKRLVEETK